MLEDSAVVHMEKKATPRQSNLAKPNSATDRKNDSNSATRHGRFNKRRENGGGRGTAFDFPTARKPAPQKNRAALDKRPRQRGSYGGRQREEVAEVEDVEGESSSVQQRRGGGGGRQGDDGTHLLNFTFADHRQGHVPTPRHYRPKYWKKHFSKEQYLQANCQFVVKDSGDYAVQACDPDALVDWDLVEQVRTFSFGQTTCPICLHPPTAGKITKCGHVYCWACVLHYLSLDDKNSSRCPICFDDVKKSDLRSVKVVEEKEHKVGEIITLKLMKRARESTYAVPCADWEDRQGQPQHIHDQLNTEYAKVLVASAAEIQASVIEEERQALLAQLAAAEDSEICFIESALVSLSEREVGLEGQRQATQENRALMEKLAAGRGGANSNSSSNDSGGSNSKERANNGGAGSTGGGAATPPVVLSRPLPKNMSFDGSKIRKQYADAFDELEVEEEDGGEEESVVSGEFLSDQEDAESIDSPLSLSLSTASPSLEHCLATPGAGPLTRCSVSSEEEPLSIPSDESLFAIPAEGDAMTTEEAVEQLEMPAEADSATGANAAATPNTPLARREEGNRSKQYFYFYQASDGQQIYLHSINARCICREYGSLEHGPPTITAKIVDKEVTFMNEDIRKRVRYLSHVPKACEFQVVEVQLQPPTVSQNTLRHFVGELKRRAQYRQKVRRDDRRNARKQHIQERMSYGIYPEVKLALDSTDQFPAPLSTEDGHRRRHSSLTDMSSLTTTSTTTTTPAPSTAAAAGTTSTSPREAATELSANAAEFVPAAAAKSESSSPNAPCFFSFAAALKKAKQPAPAPSPWGPSGAGTPSTKGITGAAGPNTPGRRPDSEESDNEDRVPVPQFKNSFSQAISAKLDTLTAKEEGSQASGKGGKKKKKKEKIMLFSTDMMRR